MTGQRTIDISSVLGLFVLIAALCFPAMNIGDSLPTIHVLDVCLPFFLFLIIQKKAIAFKELYVFIPFVFCVYVLFTIFIQGHSTMRHDYFEVYKWFKYGVTLLFFSQVNFQFFKKAIPILFGALIVINTIHFFNLFNFNELLKGYYNGGMHIEYFGKNSLGEPAVKRLVGTMGNPNINAILFGVFSIYYFPVHFSRKTLAFFFVSLLFMFLCQSRTSLLFLAAMYLVVLVFYSRIWTKKQWMTVLLGTIIAYLMAWMFASSFFQYTSYNNSLLDGSALFSGSARGRFETWYLLFGQILEYPIFGHGPYKSYFYANRIYSENEYILMFWRYGIIGLFVYLSFYVIPFFQFIKTRNPTFIPVILLLAIMSISALTNNPLTERNIELLFCIGLAWGYQLFHSNRRANEKE
ncbi:MAG: hypothetical protein RLZZ531_1253 [Bacteroidota bacterium]|jgi:O-antigen ligase